MRTILLLALLALVGPVSAGPTTIVGHGAQGAVFVTTASLLDAAAAQLLAVAGVRCNGQPGACITALQDQAMHLEDTATCLVQHWLRNMTSVEVLVGCINMAGVACLSFAANASGIGVDMGRAPYRLGITGLEGYPFRIVVGDPGSDQLPDLLLPVKGILSLHLSNKGEAECN